MPTISMVGRISYSVMLRTS